MGNRFPTLIRVVFFIAILASILAVNACTVVYSATLQPSPTPTPFQPKTFTPTLIPTMHTPAPGLRGSVTPTQSPIVLDVPILLYHHIAKAGADQRYYVSPANFEAQMQWLVDHGYQAITESELSEVIVNGGTLPEKPVIITFDDGNADFFAGAFPVMSRLHLIGVAFLVTGRIDKPGSVSSEQVEDLINASWEIGSHTVNHADLLMKSSDLDEEIFGSKVWLEAKYGIEVISFAYPFGSMNTSIAQLVEDDGYTSAARLGGRIHQSLGDLYFLGRTEIRGEYTMEQFAALMPWK